MGKIIWKASLAVRGLKPYFSPSGRGRLNVLESKCTEEEDQCSSLVTATSSRWQPVTTQARTHIIWRQRWFLCVFHLLWQQWWLYSTPSTYAYHPSISPDGRSCAIPTTSNGGSGHLLCFHSWCQHCSYNVYYSSAHSLCYSTNYSICFLIACQHCHSYITSILDLLFYLSFCTGCLLGRVTLLRRVHMSNLDQHSCSTKCNHTPNSYSSLSPQSNLVCTLESISTIPTQEPNLSFDTLRD